MSARGPEAIQSEVRERLFQADLLPAFESAERREDRDSMITLLEQVGVAAAAQIVDARLAPPLDGMTVTERLFEVGLLDAFHRAARQRDRSRMIEMLEQVEVEGAAESVDTMLADPERYGF